METRTQEICFENIVIPNMITQDQATKIKAIILNRIKEGIKKKIKSTKESLIQIWELLIIKYYKLSIIHNPNELRN